MVIIGQKTLREKFGVDVMAQLKASVLKAHAREDGPEMELQLVLWESPTLGLCCGWRWLSRRSDRAATRQVTWTMTSDRRCCLNDP